MFTYYIEVVMGFNDGNVLPHQVLKPGTRLEVDEHTYKQMCRSAPDSVMLIEKRLPKTHTRKGAGGKKS